MKKLLFATSMLFCLYGSAVAATQDFKGTINGNTVTAGTGTLTMSAGKTLTVSETANIDEAVNLSSKAPKASPTFTGTVTAPILRTAAGDTSSLAPAASETIFTAASGHQAYLVVVTDGGNSTGWQGAWVVTTGTGSSIAVQAIGTPANVDCILSGMDVQLKNTNGSYTVGISWVVLRIK